MPSFLSFNRSKPPRAKPFLTSLPDSQSVPIYPEGDVTRNQNGNMDFFHTKEKRHSLTGALPSPKGKKPASPRLGGVSNPIRLNIDMESPPLVSYGSPSHSTGALLSGKLQIVVDCPEATLKTLDMVLVGITTTKKPISKDCPDCNSQVDELKQWHFFRESHHYERGIHAIPFSYLLPGRLPATSHSKLGSIEYHLQVSAFTTEDVPLKFDRPLILNRALSPATMDRQSIRIFPPTNITATILSPPIIHPMGEFNVSVRLTGIVDTSGERRSQRRTALRKVIWRLEEHSKIISRPCAKHVHKLGKDAKAAASESLGRGMEYAQTHTIGSGEMHKGWKSDFDVSGGGGSIELEFPVAPKTNSSSHHASSSSPLPCCDVEAPNGFHVTHTLLLELVILDEIRFTVRDRDWTPLSESARVLRMNVNEVVTERMGMGISWDEEQPPTYEDVPASPPVYPAGAGPAVGPIVAAAGVGGGGSGPRGSVVAGEIHAHDGRGLLVPAGERDADIEEGADTMLGAPAYSFYDERGEGGGGSGSGSGGPAHGRRVGTDESMGSPRSSGSS
ncbi:hypothetical protein MMC25_002655 [Agyrium rufum]|nr:hypothetical protein [Agyrium rufum]